MKRKASLCSIYLYFRRMMGQIYNLTSKKKNIICALSMATKLYEGLNEGTTHFRVKEVRIKDFLKKSSLNISSKSCTLDKIAA